MTAGATAFGIGIATIAADGSVLDTHFHHCGLGKLPTGGKPKLDSLAVQDPIQIGRAHV